MFLAILLLSGSFTFSHNGQTLIAGQDAWTFTLKNASVGDKLEILAYKDGISLGKFLICTVQEDSSCFSKAAPQVQDIGLWAGPVFINGVESGTFQVYVSREASCNFPNWIDIQGAKFPCWTLERVRTQYQEAEENVKFYRWLMDLPFSEVKLENENAFFPTFSVIEHPDIFMVNGSSAVGVYRMGGINTSGWDVIEYSLKHETTAFPMVLMHEFGHKRAFDEEQKWNLLDAFLTFGWWHFGHGDFLDPLVKAINHTKNWFFRRMPLTHSYWPGQVGHEPAGGTPGAFPPVFPLTNKIVSQNLFLNYHFEQDNKTAVCIIRLK